MNPEGQYSGNGQTRPESSIRVFNEIRANTCACLTCTKWRAKRKIKSLLSWLALVGFFLSSFSFMIWAKNLPKTKYEIQQLRIDQAEQAEKEATVERLQDALDKAREDAGLDDERGPDDGHYGL
jgi:hypothetical protein